MRPSWHSLKCYELHWTLISDYCQSVIVPLPLFYEAQIGGVLEVFLIAARSRYLQCAGMSPFVGGEVDKSPAAATTVHTVHLN